MGNSLKHHIRSVQVLRGVAALMVVLHHLQNQTQRLGLPYVAADALQAGVDIFFVISGFIMWVSTSGGRALGALEFYRNRIIRIVPLYWCITSIVVAAAIIHPQAMYTTVFDFHHVVLSFLFVASSHPVTGLYQPILVPGWSLNLEMFFYLIFGLAIAAAKRRPSLKSGMIAAILLALYGLGKIIPQTGPISFYTQGIILEFLAGILIGMAYIKGKRLPTVWCHVLIAAGVVVLLVPETFPQAAGREVYWGLPATAIVAGAVFAPPFATGMLDRLGDWSYSLYLTHPITLAACHFAWRSAPHALPVGLFPWFAILAATAAAFLVYRFAEVPLTNAAKAALKPTPPPQSSTGQAEGRAASPDR